MRNNKYLLLAIIFTIVTGILIFQFLNNLNKREYIVVARTNIPKYTNISSSMVEIMSVHPSGIQPSAVREINHATGHYATEEIASGEHILKSKISDNRDSKDFTGELGPEERAIFIPLNLKQGVGGAIHRGDLIDIIYVSFDHNIGFNISKTMMQRVVVLDVRSDHGQSMDYSEKSQTMNGIVILATAQESEKIAYCLENGQIYISKHPYNGKITMTEGIYYENLYKD